MFVTIKFSKKIQNSYYQKHYFQKVLIKIGIQTEKIRID